jgi:hypothetical protein
VLWLALFGAALLGAEQLAGWPAQPLLLERLPDADTIQIWLNSPTRAAKTLLPLAFDLAWAVWALTILSIVVQVTVDLLDALTRGAAWVTSLRTATEWLVLPPVRRAVDASLAGLLLARVVVQPGAAFVAGLVPAAEMSAALDVTSWPKSASDAPATDPAFAARRNAVQIMMSEDSSQESAAPLEVIYTVQRGDTLSAIGLRFSVPQ